jgi:hypothetical protein
MFLSNNDADISTLALPDIQFVSAEKAGRARIHV